MLCRWTGKRKKTVTAKLASRSGRRGERERSRGRETVRVRETEGSRTHRVCKKMNFLVISPLQDQHVLKCDIKENFRGQIL